MRHETSFTEFWFDDLVDYGILGNGEAVQYTLKRFTHTVNGGEPKVSYLLTVTSENKYGITFDNRYGFPQAATENQWDYGRAFAGLMSQAPKDLLTLVSESTGVNLVGLI